MRMSIASLLSIVAVACTPAKAADLYGGGYKDTRGVAISQTLLPQGTYIGFGFGETFDTTNASSLALSGQGLAGDVRLGYDYLAPGSKFVFGPFVGVGFQDVTGKALTGAERWNWEAGARAGRIFNTSDLLYALAAYKQQHEGLTGTGDNPVLDGFEAGVGIEFDISNGVTLGTELDYTWYGNYTATHGVALSSSDASGKVRLGFRM